MGDGDKPNVEITRINKAYSLSVIGLLLAALLVVVLLFAGFKEAQAITSIVGLFTSVLGTVVGAFFGLQIGSSGKEQAEKRANDAENRTRALGEAADPETMARARQSHPLLFTYEP